jgi:hypothetical protein
MKRISMRVYEAGFQDGYDTADSGEAKKTPTATPYE